MSSPAQYTPQVSIIIRTKNEAHFITETLSALFGQDIDLSFEVIIIDSGSTDRTLDVARQFNVRLYEIEPSQFTYGYALNYGRKLALGRYIVNLSAHCKPVDDKWLARLLAPLISDPSIAATYGKQVPIKGYNPLEERLMIAAFRPDGDGKIKVKFSNSNCAIRKSVWEQYPFDEKAAFAEDFIWSQVLPPQYKIQYVEDAAVYHSHPLKFRFWTRRSYDNGLVGEYLKHVYGFDYPWRRRSSTDDLVAAKTLLQTANSFMADGYNLLCFVTKHGYFHYVPLFLIYFIFNRYYYRLGTKDGARLYGSSKNQGK